MLTGSFFFVAKTELSFSKTGVTSVFLRFFGTLFVQFIWPIYLIITNYTYLGASLRDFVVIFLYLSISGLRKFFIYFSVSFGITSKKLNSVGSLK